MPAVSTATSSGNQDIDGLLAGSRWAVTSLTYSFPTSASFYGTNYGDSEQLNNFDALNTTQQATVRKVLGMYASVINVTFTEVTESATVHGDLRAAQSDAPGTSWAYYPATAPYGGDSWYGNSSGWYDNPVVGNYAYHTFIHEIGHALGLKHGQEYPAMTTAHDSMEYTVMTYRSYVGQALGGGYSNGSASYAQTLMMYDIAALQHLYGANYGSHSGNTTYAWNPVTGELSIDGVGQGAAAANRVFMTVWDGGGTDTYDFSSYTTGVNADLRPGAWTITSDTQRANLGDGHFAAGNVANALLYHGDARSLIENVVGGSGNDTLTGNDAANAIRGNAGNDALSGGSGDDVLDGGIGDDALSGGTGDDTLMAGVGHDSLDGGSGTDVVDFSGFGSAAWVSLGSASAQAQTMDLPSLSGGSWRSVADITNVENVVGSAYADALAGNGAANRIEGGAGNDSIDGQGGNDVLDGGAGNDAVSGGTGDDILLAGSGHDVLDGGSGIDVVDFSGFSSAMWVWLGHVSSHAQTMDLPTLAGGTWRTVAEISNVENVVGSGFADSLAGDAYANRIDGGAGNDGIDGQGGNDVLDGGAGNDSLSGGAGDDVLLAGAGYDLLDGGTGTDAIDFSAFGSAMWVWLGHVSSHAQTMDRPTLSGGTWRTVANVTNVENVVGSAYADSLAGDGNANRIDGGAGDDGIDGQSGNDVLNGGAGNDSLSGGAGDDILLAGAGYDVLDGGAGSDVVDFSGLGSAIWLGLWYFGAAAQTRDQPTLSAGAWRTAASITNVENAVGSAYGDSLAGDDNANRLDGGAGDDGLDGRAGNDVLSGDAGDDRLDGGAGDDLLSGGIGNDILLAGSGHDMLDGGTGADVVDFSGFGSAMWVWLGHVSSHAQTMDMPTLYGGTWRTVAGISNVENVVGSAYSDSLAGDDSANRISGAAGNDSIDGQGGSDVLDGGAGDDSLSGGAGDDVLVAGAGHDLLDGGAGTDVVDFSGFGSAMWVWLGHTSSHAQTMDMPSLSGGTWRTVADIANVENVVGSAYADCLTGNANANRIEGGTGNDSIDGQAGNDLLIGGAGTDSLTGGAGADTFYYANVADGGDTITDFTRGSGNDVLDISDLLIGYSAPSDISRFVELSANGSNTVVAVNTDGVGGDFVAIATLQGVAMSASLLNDLLVAGNLIA